MLHVTPPLSDAESVRREGVLLNFEGPGVYCMESSLGVCVVEVTKTRERKLLRNYASDCFSFDITHSYFLGV